MPLEWIEHPSQPCKGSILPLDDKGMIINAQARIRTYIHWLTASHSTIELHGHKYIYLNTFLFKIGL